MIHRLTIVFFVTGNGLLECNRLDPNFVVNIFLIIFNGDNEAKIFKISFFLINIFFQKLNIRANIIFKSEIDFRFLGHLNRS
ncbi:hypothetical protein BpHYR1_025312 [Brachionus plicatilis]|uniref:Uncharacterized protein n=1 Tax=Brachionus plicatilis TaxID=10195 RepID=A0A3M7S2R0_BRAPC|nr:hypothetical protein BpHYR1_025312 [Brachionus plicatilis]